MLWSSCIFVFLKYLGIIITLSIIETWIYFPVIGEIYREFVKNYYQQNLFIKNQIRLDGKPVNLSKVNHPFLNVIASKDDLVSVLSSKALSDVITSQDKTTLEFSSGHVGLLIGHRAHNELWPKVGDWLIERSF